MRFVRKNWTPEQADRWSVHDTLAVIVSPVIYVCLLVGVSLALLLRPAGFVVLGAGIVLLVVLWRVIDPKLAAVSRGYEQRQKEYIEELEKKVKWEE